MSIWVKLFVLFHLFAITVWAMPAPPPAIQSGQTSPSGSQWITYLNDKHFKSFPPVILYLGITGFWQYWDMFSPDPAQTDNYGDAIITYRDGSQKRYQYPRMFLESIPQKFLGERFRKFFERAGDKDYAFLWPVMALRIAFLNDNPNNPPVDVKVYLHQHKIVPPGQPQPEGYTSKLIYDYAVDQHELDKERKRGL